MKKTSILLLALFAGVSGSVFGQQDQLRQVMAQDSLFWRAYNECDVEKMSSFFSEDIEFYHDKGGATYSLKIFKESLHKGLCGNPKWRLRREALPGVQAFPMNNYGALVTGEHIFFINETGKKEFLDGYGKFANLWKLQNGVWKMTRVLSYDHGDPKKHIK